MTNVSKQDHFLSVIEANKGILYKVAHSYCKDPEDRQDLIQEIILKLWRSFDDYDEQFRHSTWIYRIALNTAISFYRKETTRKALARPLAENVFQMADLDANGPIEERTLFLHRFISELKELDKALMLLFLEEKSHKEIAEIMGITETNVATKIGRLKQVLKLRFSQHTM